MVAYVSKRKDFEAMRQYVAGRSNGRALVKRRRPDSGSPQGSGGRLAAPGVDLPEAIDAGAFLV